MINILLNGCEGKMGKSIIEYLNTNNTNFNILYKISRNNIDLYNNINLKPDVIIDFSSPASSFIALDYAIKNNIPIVIATTGFNEKEEFKIGEYSKSIPIFKSSNVSYGINVFSNIAALLAEKLNNSDIEILEKHHKNKKDAPSGTAVMIADNINKKCNNKYTYNFDRLKKPRLSKNEIGFSSIRGGSLVGEHIVLFLDEYEKIEISHTAYSRNIFVEGALNAAQFIITQKSGLFGMDSLL